MKRKILLIISFLICSVVSLYAGNENYPWSAITKEGIQVEFNTSTHKLTILSTGTSSSYTVPGYLTYTDGKTYPIDTVEFCNQADTSQLRTINFTGVNLKAVICTNNSILTTVNVNASVNKNAIKYFDFSGCISLAAILNIGEAVEYLNVEGCVSLRILSCKNNKIETLDVSTCQSLQNLNCNGCTNLTNITLPAVKTNLQTVNVSDCSSLQTLNLQDYSNITDISVSGCESLTNLTLPSNNTKIKALKFTKISQTELDVEGYLNLDTLICDSSDIIQEIKVSANLRYLRTVKLPMLMEVDISKCAKLNYLKHEDTRALFSGIEYCKNLLWYINGDGYLVNNTACTYHYIKQNSWGTLCWPEDIRSKDVEVYKVVGAKSEDQEHIDGLYLEKVENPDPVYASQGFSALEAGKPYILKYLNDDIKFYREKNTLTDSIFEGENGLIGTYKELTLKYSSTAPLAIIKSGSLWEVDDDYSIPGFSSYINLSAIPTDNTTEIYIPISEGGIEELQSNIENRKAENGLVDVFSIHGVKVRNDVNAEDATTGLPRGVYIVNGKIVIK